MAKITRFISIGNSVIASSALAFQVFVLYPWHKELDTSFESLKKEHLKLLDAVGNNVSEQQRQNLSTRINELESRSSKRWWWA